MSNLQLLIEENKSRFQIDKDSLVKKIKSALDCYLLVKPATNLDTILHSRLSKAYRTFQDMLLDCSKKLSKGYILDMKNTRNNRGKYLITYLKPEAIQLQEKAAIKKRVKEEYIACIEKEKAQWITELTINLSLEAQDNAIKESQIKTIAIKDELLAMLAAK
jgi:hypothetical protein